LLPVIYASSMGITITMSTKRLKKKGYDIHSNKKILETISEFDLDDINEIILETREVIFRVLKRFGFYKRKTIVSIDFHDKPFYGNKHIKEIIGTKRKLGTNFAYRYATICICEEGIRFNLATIAIGQRKLKKTLIKELIDIARRYVSIGLVLLDRGFNGIDVSRVLDEKKAKYVMPFIENKKIKRICDTPKKLSVMPYTYYEDRPKEYQKEIRVIIDKRNKDDYYFTTNIPGDSRAILSAIILAYRKRWGIETGYRVADEFYAWTTSVKFSTRSFLGLLSFIMQDLWTLYNFLEQRGTKMHQPRTKLLKGCRTVFKFIKKSIQELSFYWRPNYEAELFRDDIADCVKRLLI
jgi:predicted house-cleaning noncanonical NTP pyrophosphatase (MazG superfamily)